MKTNHSFHVFGLTGLLVVGVFLPSILTVLVEYHDAPYYSFGEESVIFFLYILFFTFFPGLFSLMAMFFCISQDTTSINTTNIVRIGAGCGIILLNISGTYFIDAYYCIELLKHGPVELRETILMALPIMGIHMAIVGSIVGGSLGSLIKYAHPLFHVSFRSFIRLSNMLTFIGIGIAIVLAGSHFANTILLWLILIWSV